MQKLNNNCFLAGLAEKKSEGLSLGGPQDVKQDSL